MSSRFNTLLLGNPRQVIDAIDHQECTVDELRLAMINALRRINVLEEKTESLQRQLNETRSHYNLV